jgi:mannose-6-phosphate isomerase-like protein (cupin superfamily)/CDGSH-type Zn-finger protein
MSEAKIAQLKPYLMTLTGGRTYLWCRCGRSANQPLCDGSHKGTGFEPIRYVAASDGEEVLFCGCKRTSSGPFCDGTHSNLPGGSPQDDPDSPQNRAVPLVTDRSGARRSLNGNCYVFSPSLATMRARGSLHYCEIIGRDFGSLHQTQTFMRVAGAASPVMSFGASDTILFVASGSGTVTISGRPFTVTATDGLYIRPGEAFQLAATQDSQLDIFATNCPHAELQWVEAMPEAFDIACPQRIVSVDAAQRTAMGPRYFQLLVDKRIGSQVITQFIGHIPRSKAAPHRHLYEEAILVLNGSGCMWTEDRKVAVSTGDVIFLPRKQLHSLQATGDDGMDVVGVICPGDNPSINY